MCVEAKSTKVLKTEEVSGQKFWHVIFVTQRAVFAQQGTWLHLGQKG